MSDILENVIQSRANINSLITRSAWDNPEFRARFVADPKAVIAEKLGQALPKGLRVAVHEEDGNTLHFVIPAKPSLTPPEELSDADLEKVAGGTLTPDDDAAIAGAVVGGVVGGVVAGAAGAETTPGDIVVSAVSVGASAAATAAVAGAAASIIGTAIAAVETVKQHRW